jgi:hypothetical protein
MGLDELVKQFGFPLAIAIFFIWQYISSNKEHKDDLKGISTQAVSAIDKSTEALEKNTDVMVKATQTLDRASVTLDRVESKLEGGR